MSPQPQVPYQAYKSKRHSRTSSMSHLVPNVSPPPISRPSSCNPNSSTLAVPLPPGEAQPGELVSSNGFSPSTSVNSHPTPSNGLHTPGSSESSPPSSKSTSPAPRLTKSSIPFQLSSSAPDMISKPALNESINGKSTAEAGPSSVPSTPSTQPTELPGQAAPIPATRRSSTFRHVPSRGSRPALPSSPLRPFQSHSRNTSRSSTSRLAELSRPQAPAESRSRITSLSSLASEPVREKPLPVISVDQGTPSSPPKIIRTSSQQHPSPSGDLVSPPPRSSSLAPPKTPSKSPSRTNTSTPTTSPAPPVTTHSAPTRSSAPYRPGFQPKGVCWPRTDEFITTRNSARDVGRIERTKLERRLEKLIDLHFSPGAEKPKQPPVNRRASSFFDFDLSDLKNMDASGLWKGVLQSQTFQGGAKSDIRAAEQRITPWQDDASVSRCPLCSYSFHPLSNRKHHCRLCGQIICSLPVKHPQRPTSCSVLFIVDPKTKRIEEVGEGVDYGVRRRRSSTLQGKGKGKDEELPEDEKFLRGVRICRECRHVLLRQQYHHEVLHVPAFVKHYEAFISLEKEIEDSLPQFQELVLSLSNDGQPTKEASAARKRLLEAFSQYDALSKRISQLPCPGGPGSSQHRVQMAIHTRANLFLQQNMFPLQSLPKPQKAKSKPKDEPAIDPDSELAHTLQPLLEQEALLESFVEEANAHRKFEDAKTLKANLMEIRAEIDKIFASAEIGNGRSPGKTKR